MDIRIQWSGIYALLMVCFFLIGLYFPSLGWAGFYILPLVLSVFYGYFRRVIGEAFSTLLVGLILYGFVAVALCSILSSFELFWPYLENLGIIGFDYIDTFDEALAGVMILLIGIFAGQITIGIFGIVVGIGLDKLEGILSPSEERIVTYGDFTSEGVTKAGVIKVRVIGTIPESLYKWMKQEIEAGNYVNQSHIMETALRQLKRKESRFSQKALSVSKPFTR